MGQREGGEYPASTQRQTEADTDTQTHRHTDTQTHRHTDTQRCRDAEMQRCRHRHTEMQTFTPFVVVCVCVCVCRWAAALRDLKRLRGPKAHAQEELAAIENTLADEVRAVRLGGCSRRRTIGEEEGKEEEEEEEEDVVGVLVCWRVDIHKLPPLQLGC